jgi:hypothetical protein
VSTSTTAMACMTFIRSGRSKQPKRKRSAYVREVAWDAQGTGQTAEAIGPSLSLSA